jgi:hypothetical protein
VLGLYQIRDGKFARAQMFYFDTAAALRFLDEAGVTAAPASRDEYPPPTAARGRAAG